MGRGLTLIETIISCFLLVSCLMVCVTLFNKGLQWNSQIVMKVRAAQLGQRALSQLRLQSLQPTGPGRFGYDDLVDRVYSESDAPEFTTTLRFRRQALDWPCSGLEAAQTDRCRMTGSCKQVQVEVRWGPRPSQLLTLCSFLAEPPRQAGRVVVAPQGPPAGQLHHDEHCGFQAHAEDAQGRTIEDVSFEWQFDDQADAWGTLDPSRDGSRVQLTHVLYRPDGVSKFYVEGSTMVRAYAKVQGVLVSQPSAAVTLAP